VDSDDGGEGTAAEAAGIMSPPVNISANGSTAAEEEGGGGSEEARGGALTCSSSNARRSMGAAAAAAAAAGGGTGAAVDHTGGWGVSVGVVSSAGALLSLSSL
jgi:hypothetical protein